MVTDPISDMIVRINNASLVGKPTVSVLRSKLTENIAHALKRAGYLSSVDKGNSKNELILGIVYFEQMSRIHGVERLSKPSRRIYQRSGDIRSYRSGFGNVVFSTPKGILTDVEARKMNVGGEALFKIW